MTALEAFTAMAEGRISEEQYREIIDERIRSGAMLKSTGRFHARMAEAFGSVGRTKDAASARKAARRCEDEARRIAPAPNSPPARS